MWTTLALLSVLGAAPAQAGLSLTHVRSTHGLLGPERTNETVAPGDILFVCFDIEGVRVDDEGKVRYSMAIDVSDSTGKVLSKQKPKDTEATTSLGGSTVPAYATLNVGLDTPPGNYEFKVTVKDLASGSEKSLTRAFKVLAKDFALVRAMASVDTDARYPAAIFANGQGVWLHCSAVGFTRGGAEMQPNVAFEMRVLDEAGKPTFTKPIAQSVQKGVSAKDAALPMAFALSLNRPGKFTIELQAVDRNSNKKAKIAFPITVQSPK